jgi:hypothetical protein
MDGPDLAEIANDLLMVQFGGILQWILEKRETCDWQDLELQARWRKKI